MQRFILLYTRFKLKRVSAVVHITKDALPLYSNLKMCLRFVAAFQIHDKGSDRQDKIDLWCLFNSS